MQARWTVLMRVAQQLQMHDDGGVRRFWGLVHQRGDDNQNDQHRRDNDWRYKPFWQPRLFSEGHVADPSKKEPDAVRRTPWSAKVEDAYFCCGDGAVLSPWFCWGFDCGTAGCCFGVSLCGVFWGSVIVSPFFEKHWKKQLSTVYEMAMRRQKTIARWTI
jgi:hypothetical protein